MGLSAGSGASRAPGSSVGRTADPTAPASTVVLLACLLAALLPFTASAQQLAHWDFESGDLQGWKLVAGDLGTQPVSNDDDRYGGNFGKQGKWFLGTYENPGGDGRQGELRSPVFTLSGGKLSLLVGGGNHPQETFIALVLADGDRELQRACGRDAERMLPVVWEVAAARGRRVYLRLVDRHSGGWGHLNVDDICELGPAEVAALARQEQERQEAVTREYRRWRAAPLQPAARTVYRGEHLRNLVMPLGGVGAGNLGLCGDGALRQWQVCNRVNAGAFVPYGFLAVRAQAEGQAPVARVLQTARVDSLPAVAATEFVGEFPLAMIDYPDEALPLKVGLQAFSPLIPLDATSSGLPTVCFVLSARNTGTRPMQASFLMSLQNFVGWDGRSAIGGRDNPGYGGNENELLRRGNAVSLAMRNPKLPPASPSFGTLALTCLRPEATAAAQWDDSAALWSDFTDDGSLASSVAGPSEAGRTHNGALAWQTTVPAGGQVEVPFLLSWHFPNRMADYDAARAGLRLGNAYGRRFPDAVAVAQYAGDNFGTLRGQTLLFHDTFYRSNLPYWFLDCVSSQISTLCSQTCLWIEDGSFHAFEGCGCCPMNCTHVWNYEQTLAHLFPELERNMRHTDLFVQQDPSGFIHHRTVLPLDLPRSSGPFTDGHLSTVSKAYREHRLSADSTWLRRNWPRVKLAMDWAIGAYDGDGDGLIQVAQPNTYDCTIYGANSFIGSQWLAALRAAEEMARRCHDREAAARYRAIFEKGSAALDRRLWNGEWWVQAVDLREHPRDQYGTGCHSDQLLGQWWADLNGLGYVLPRAHVRTALRSIVSHNFLPRFEGFHQAPRVFASDDERGLLCCTWPRGGRPPAATLYSDEVWTGIEYEVAGLLLSERMVPEAYQVIRAARDRYNGTRRSPWNEIECGDHYARAMSSYALLLAAEGYQYDGPAGVLRFAPRVQPGNLQAFFSGAEGWGTFTQRREARRQTNSLKLAYGSLRLTRLALQLPQGAAGVTATAQIAGEALPARVEIKAEGLEFVFRHAVRLEAGDELTLTARW